jgi:two-component system nitrogen regulation response regulator GlnG
MSRILIADDEASIRFVLREALEAAGHDVEEADSSEQARKLIEQQGFDVAFLDILMPGQSGLELLSELTEREGRAPLVVIMTAQNTFQNAIEAMKLGAFNYLTKPFDLAEVEALIEKALRLRALHNEVATLRSRVDGVWRGGETLVGTSAAMIETFKTIGRVAASEASVLIRGESGTGKELVARAIHYHSRRRDRPFTAVNMSALPTELIEAELFGHEKGAFTGATEARAGRFRESEGGTLLLDEIGDLPLSLQTKLLRVLQEREVTPLGGKQALPIDVRILAATHQELEAAVADGSFREDLYFRLNVVPSRVAPLRERLEDVPALVEHFVERFSRELNVPKRWPTEGAIRLLSAQPWPGNVRELENAIKRALVLASGDVITEDDLRGAVDARGGAETDWTSLVRSELREMLDAEGEPAAPGPYWSFVQRLERAVISEALGRSGGNQIQAARLLGINRNTLRKKIAELEIRDGQADRMTLG